MAEIRTGRRDAAAVLDVVLLAEVEAVGLALGPDRRAVVDVAAAVDG